MIGWLALSAFAAPAPELVWADSGEGHHVALHHTPNPGRPPVVLCHGISSNHHFWDLEPGRSLAQALWDAGFDVWNLDLRGHGDAERHPDGSRQRGQWSVDDYGKQDLPAAFARVLADTGATDLSYVGHSMGGMVLAVYLASTPEPVVTRAAVVGSPLDFRDPDPVVEILFGAAPVGEALGRVPTPAGAKVIAVTGRDTFLKLDEIVHNPENVDRKVEARMLREVVSPLYRGEIEQLALVRPDGEFRSADGSVVYREALADVHVPMLFVAGRADRVVSPDRVWSYYEALGTDDKRFVVASVANGMHGDYGHLDLGCGDHAADDIFPLVVAWLK